MGFEPTTTTLATWCSTPELLPPVTNRQVRPIGLELCVLHEQDTSTISNCLRGKQEGSPRNFRSA